MQISSRGSRATLRGNDMRKHLKFLSAGIAGVSFMLLAVSSSSLANQVKTKSGTVEGSTSADGKIQVFKGIPFAAPPVGDLRWKEPQPVKPWGGVRKCESFGPSPMQSKPIPFSMWS